MRTVGLLVVCAWVVASARLRADETLFRYEGNVHPLDAGALVGSLCEDPCSDSVEDGHYVLRWRVVGDAVNFQFQITAIEEPPPPPNFWVEWRFRSNHALNPSSISCDANFKVQFPPIEDRIHMYGDAAFNDSGDFGIAGLDLDEFHTFRYESIDGIDYTLAVDGTVFARLSGDTPLRSTSVALRGRGGCIGDSFPNMINEWDFIRYGTISFGDQVIASDPPQGLVDARKPLDRFTVTFDSANYVYIDDILVESTGGEAPVVLQTRRRENDEPDTVEIVLDRPVTFGETTRFTMTDAGPAPVDGVNVIEYHFATGDFDNSGTVTLTDHAQLSTCMNGPTAESASNTCTAFDFTADKAIDLWDFAFFQTVFTGDTP